MEEDAHRLAIMEDAMSNRQSSDLERERTLTQTHQKSGLVSLHPAVYRIIAFLAAVFVLAAWSFWAGGHGGIIGLVLAVVTLIVGFLLLVPGALARIWFRHHEPAEDPGEPTMPFREWLREDVVVQRYRLRGSEAALTALMPIAAGAVGMLLLALIHAIEIA
jgi:hypothetical protein